MDKLKLAECFSKCAQYKRENPDDSDHYTICEAVWVYFGKAAELANHYNDEMICENQYRMYWLIPDEEGEKTFIVCEGELFVDTIENVTKYFADKYCNDHNKVICKHCGGFVDDKFTEGVAECEDCGHHLDGTENPEITTILTDKEWELIEDGDYEMLFRWRHLLPTHETPKSQTALWIRLQYTEECTEHRYYASFVTVNPSMAGKKNREGALDSCGFDEERRADILKNRKCMEQVLIQYGTYATHFELCGNSKSDVIKRLMKHWFEMEGLTGFVIDRPQNAIGSSGWDFMRGDPLKGIRK